MYYIFKEKKVIGPFGISTIQENLNAEIWLTTDLYTDGNEWKPLSELFMLQYTSKSPSILEQLGKKTEAILIQAKKIIPFKGLNKLPASPSTTQLNKIYPILQALPKTVPPIQESRPIVVRQELWYEGHGFPLFLLIIITGGIFFVFRYSELQP